MRVSLMRQLAAEATAVLNKRPNETSVTSGKLAKPLLRGLLGRSTRKHAIICFALSISAAMAYRYTVGEPRKKRYAEFWKTFDDHANFKRMVKAGLYSDITIEDFEAMEQETLSKQQARK